MRALYSAHGVHILTWVNIIRSLDMPMIYSGSTTTNLEILSVKFIRCNWNSRILNPNLTDVWYLDTRIGQGDNSAPFHISVYDKREDFHFRIVNFPFMDSNIPTSPVYGVYTSQLVRYAGICTSKVEFIRRIRSLPYRLQQQGFKSTLLVKSINKFFKRHCATMVKNNVTLQELRSAVRKWKTS